MWPFIEYKLKASLTSQDRVKNLIMHLAQPFLHDRTTKDMLPFSET